MSHQYDGGKGGKKGEDHSSHPYDGGKGSKKGEQWSAHPYDGGKGGKKGDDRSVHQQHGGKGGQKSVDQGSPAQPGGKGGKKGDDGIFFGRIKSLQPGNDKSNGGFGFIDCPSATDRFKRDVFVHSKELGELQVGDEVSFHVELHKDMPQARGVTKAGLAGTTPDERFIGRLHTFKADRGLGFISCDRAYAIFGRDVCIHKDYIGDWKVGDDKSFRIEMYKDMPQARDIDFTSEPGAAPPLGERYFGRIHKFIAKRKVGFIHCDEAHNVWQRDVCIHEDYMGDAKEGDDISFCVEVVKGMPQARDVSVSDNPAPAHSPDEHGTLDQCLSPEVRYVGRIHRYLPAKDYGFIRCDEAHRVWNCDVFIHRDYLGNAQEGDEISFSVEVKKGKPQAREVMLADGSERVAEMDYGHEEGGSSASGAREGTEGGSSRGVRGGRKRHRGRERREEVCEVPEEERTTIMLKNTPPSFVRSYLLDTLDSFGFGGQYDFVYVPTDLETSDSLGSAVVNMTTNAAATDVMTEFQSWDGWKAMDPDRDVEVTWSIEQGFENHIVRYRNSDVMHESVPEEFRPILFNDGSTIPFPEPTMEIRRPKIGGSRPHSDRHQDPGKSHAEGEYEEVPGEEEEE